MKEEKEKRNARLIEEIGPSLGIILPSVLSEEELHTRISQHINYLINHDFEKLIYYLYRADVNENKMRHLLQQKEGENAAGLIADLIIERQLEKIKSRRQFRQQDNDIDENEKW